MHSHIHSVIHLDAHHSSLRFFIRWLIESAVFSCMFFQSLCNAAQNVLYANDLFMVVSLFKDFSPGVAGHSLYAKQHRT